MTLRRAAERACAGLPLVCLIVGDVLERCRGAGRAARNPLAPAGAGPGRRRRRTVRDRARPGARRGGSARSAQPHHPGPRSRAAECARPGRVRGDVRARAADRSSESVGRADLPGRQPRQRRRGGERRRATSRWSAAGRATSSRPRPIRRSPCRSPGTPTDRRSPAPSSPASSTFRPARRRCRSV